MGVQYIKLGVIVSTCLILAACGGDSEDVTGRWTLDFENYNVGDLAEAVGATDRFQRDNSSEIDSSQTIVANPDPDSSNMSSRVVRSFFARGSSGPTLIPPKHRGASN